MDEIIKILSTQVPISLLVIGIFAAWFLQNVISSFISTLKDNRIEKLKAELSRDSFVYENKKKAFVDLLTAYSDVLNTIDEKYNYESGSHYPIDEAEIRKLEKIVNQNSLYVSEDVWIALTSIKKLLRINSDFLSNVTGEGDYSFGYYDLEIIKQLFDWVIRAFRYELKLNLRKNDIEEKSMLTFYSILVLFKNLDRPNINEEVIRDIFESYDFYKNDINDIREKYFSHNKCLKEDVEKIISYFNEKAIIHQFEIISCLKKVKEYL